MDETGIDPLVWAKSEIGIKDKQLFAARQAILAGGIVEGQLRAELKEVQFSHGLLEKDLAYQEQDVLPKLRAELEEYKTGEVVPVSSYEEVCSAFDKAQADVDELRIILLGFHDILERWTRLE